LGYVFELVTCEKARGKPHLLICNEYNSHILGNFIAYLLERDKGCEQPQVFKDIVKGNRDDVRAARTHLRWHELIGDDVIYYKAVAR
jgi:hypothetical protein